MKYTFQIVDVFSSTPFGGNQLAVLPDAVGTACALVMKRHVRLSNPIRLILEENVGPVTVDVAQRNGGFHGALTLWGKIEAPTGAPSPTELAAVLFVEPAEVNQVFFAGVGVPICFAQLNSNEVVDRAAINRAAWVATLSRAWSPHILFFAGNLRDGGKLYARMWAPASALVVPRPTSQAAKSRCRRPRLCLRPSRARPMRVNRRQ
jgi:predicted PhzF superfamily epimerase YddE/YHI9